MYRLYKKLNDSCPLCRTKLYEVEITDDKLRNYREYFIKNFVENQDDLIKLTYKVKIKVKKVHQIVSFKDNLKKVYHEEKYYNTKNKKEYISIIKREMIKALDSNIEFVQKYYNYNNNPSYTIGTLHRSILAEYNNVINLNKLQIKSPYPECDCTKIISFFVK